MREAVWRRFGSVFLCVGSLLLIGCGQPDDPKPKAVVEMKGDSNVVVFASVTNILPGMQASPLESTNIARAYEARGVIRSFPEGGRTVVVRHEDIPGFMPKMTMEFDLKDTNELRGFAVGDLISFKVRANAEESWIEGLKRASTSDVVSAIPADPSSAALLNIAQLKVGEVIPDVELLSETGLGLRFSELRGRAVAFTFIFTRCPLPDFCPRMNQHFSKAREILKTQSGGATNWQFLSISFDPDFDKPGVLTRYAFSYRGNDPDRWIFASAPNDAMKTMAAQLDFRFANEGGSFLHNLRTVVIDAKGALYRQFDGNKWKAEDLAQALSEAAALK